MKFTVIIGHPDPSEARLNRALANGYAQAATAAGHDVRVIDVAAMEFPLLRTAEEFYREETSPAIRHAQADIVWADHLAFFYPLWIGDVPALFKAFIERTFRPGFAMQDAGPRRFPRPLLGGKSARLVVTMGMPALVYRTLFGAYTAKNLALNLRRCGVAPVRETFIGSVGSESVGRRWIAATSRLVRRDACTRAKVGAGRLLARAGAAAAGAYLVYVALAWARFGKTKRASSLLDEVMPEYDVRLDHRTTIHAPAELAYETLAQTELERSPLVQALFRARRILLRGAASPKMPAGGLFEQLDAIGWRIVAQERERELVFGAVTTPWQADSEFIGLDAQEFRSFRTPGYVKIAFSLRVEPQGDNCAAYTETRALATDSTSRRRFRRYWAFLSPGIEIIRVLLLAQLKAETEARQRAQARL